MNDLISRQAAIDVLNVGAELLNRVLDDADIVGVERAKYEWGLGLIESYIYDMKELPSAQQWTPCSEGLPDEDFWSGRGRQFSDHVLVTIVNHANDDEPFTDMAQTVDGIWQLSHDVDGDCSLPNWCEVIAWMPQPEPYKGEES